MSTDITTAIAGADSSVLGTAIKNALETILPRVLEKVSEAIVASDEIFKTVEELINDEFQNNLEHKEGYIELNEESPIVAIWFSEACSNLDFPFGYIRFDLDASTEELARQIAHVDNFIKKFQVIKSKLTAAQETNHEGSL